MAVGASRDAPVALPVVSPGLTTTKPRCSSAAGLRKSSGGLLGGQHLVEQAGRLLVVGLLGQGKLRDQDLACLREHALLAGGEATILVAAPQVTDDLGHLDDVAGGELFQ